MNVLKVCLSYAHVETCLEKEDSKGNARNVFENADTVLNDGGSQEERAMLPEAWCDFERGEVMKSHRRRYENVCHRELRRSVKIIVKMVQMVDGRSIGIMSFLMILLQLLV